MDIYKIKTGNCAVKRINTSNFEEDTQMQKPYYVNENVQYAVCPRCDNPIQILGLYKKLKNTDTPYGKHCIQAIPGIARYNQDAYDSCPLANHQTPNPEGRRNSLEGIPNTLLHLLKEEFDRIVYILHKETGIIFDPALLNSMLETFCDAQGFLYKWASVSNLPWIFAHMSFSKSLFKKRVKQDSELWNSINENAVGYGFNKKGQLDKTVKKWVPPISFCFYRHTFSGNGEREQILFQVSQLREGETPNNSNIILRKTLEIEPTYFMNLVHLPEDRARRNDKLCKIAKEFWDSRNL